MSDELDYVEGRGVGIPTKLGEGQKRNGVFIGNKRHETNDEFSPACKIPIVQPAHLRPEVPIHIMIKGKNTRMWHFDREDRIFN
jgi:hypothetical protein